MKKFFFTTLLLALTGLQVANAQNDNSYNVVVNLSNGATITLGANDVTEITFNEGELTVTGTSITKLVETIDSLKDAGKTLDDTIEALQAFKEENEDRLKNLDKTLELIDGRITTNSEKAEELEGRVQELEETVKQLEAAIAELKKGTDQPQTLPTFVDLGLSVKWASYNIGATKPEETGNYYAWGEIETKEDFSKDTYKFIDEYEEVKMPGKFNSSLYNYAIGGDPELDVVTATYGEGYRLPTIEEARELIANCEFEWVEENGQRCGKFTASNGNFILLPAASYMSGTSLRNGTAGRCYYWTAESEEEGEDTAMQLTTFNTTKNVSKNRVYTGAPVRGVQP